MDGELKHVITPLDAEGEYACSCGRTFTSRFPFVACPDQPEGPMPLVGYDLALIKALATAVNRNVHRHSVTRLRSTRDKRGFWFEAHLVDAAGVPTTRVARVTIELDRVFAYCTTHGRQHDDDGDRTCQWALPAVEG